MILCIPSFSISDVVICLAMMMFKRFILLCAVLMCSAASFSQELMIYGYDPGMKTYSVFLGKITAAADDEASIWNTGCAYGDKNSELSIWNVSGEYGSDGGSCSPFNADAEFPPKVMDEDRNDYGFLTVDLNRRQRCNMDMTDVICRFHYQIVANIKKWYSIIFGE